MKPVSGRQMCQALEGRGWVLVRVSGQHHVYRHPVGGKQIAVPVRGNKDLKSGTQWGITRDTAPTVTEL